MMMRQPRYREKNTLVIIIIYMVFISFAPLVGLYAIFGLCLNKSKWRKYLPFYILFVFTLSHGFSANCETDLDAYYTMIDDIARLKSFGEVLVYGNEGLVLRNLLFWFVGKTGDKQLLLSFTNTVCYGVAAYISCDVSETEGKLNWIPYIMVFQLVSLPSFSIICNVRNVCAFSLAVLAVYFDIKKRKHIGIAYMLYVAVCLLHQSCVVLIILRIVIGICKKHFIPVIISFVFFPFLINAAYYYLLPFVSVLGGSIGRILSSAIVKAFAYWNTEQLSSYERIIMNSTGNLIQKYLMMLMALCFLMLGYWCFKKCSDERERKYVLFAVLICGVVLACNIFIAPHYWRFYSAVIVLCPVILVPTVKKYNLLPPLYKLALLMLPVLASGVFAMNMRRVILYTNFKPFFYGLAVNNVYSLFINTII